MKEEKLKCNMKGRIKKNDRNKELNKWKEEREMKTHASSDEEQCEICLSCWCLPSDFFLDLSLVFPGLQVLLI